MQYMTSRQKATEWSVTKRMVNYWCANGQIEGAYKEGSRWWIPVDVERPGEEERLRRMRAYTVRITGKKSVAVGIQDFEALRRDQMFYVDKTDFIRQWWESGETTTLITRPRRFGKTLNLSMLNCFFSVFYENRADLFEGVKVWEEKNYHKLQGRFPVIFLSFAGVKGTTFEAVLRQINYGIVEVYRRFERILDMSRFTERERQDFGRISWDMDAATAAQSVRLLTDLLYVYYGQKPIILLDEYDTPLQEAYFNSFWDEMTAFVGAFFNNSFKTNPSLGRALLTGITRICKESIFSDLNNIDVVTQTSTKYETAFGFTEEEVKVGLARVGLLDYREKVKEWYDGFTFGQRRDMYNPWSITKFIDAEGIFDIYWANTSNNKLVSSLIRKSSKNMKMAMEQLLEGEMLHVEMDEQLDFAQLEYRESAIFSLLYATGYLRVNQKNDQEYVLMLTNKEVKIVFRRIIREWFNDLDTGYGDFRRALLHDNIEEMNYYMNMVTLSTFSYFDTGTGRGNIDETERFYHGFVLGLLADLSDQFSIRSNRESGLGRYDIILRAREENCNSYIMEFKVFDRERDENMKACVARALQQIEEKQYETELVADGIARERIRKYGFAFDGKKVLIGS